MIFLRLWYPTSTILRYLKGEIIYIMAGSLSVMSFEAILQFENTFYYLFKKLYWTISSFILAFINFIIGYCNIFRAFLEFFGDNLDWVF